MGLIAVQTKELGMFKHILVATDGSELAEQAATQGLKLGKLLNARVTAVNVTKPWATIIAAGSAETFPYQEYEAAAANEARQVLATISQLAKKADITCATTHVKDQYPAEGIISACKDLGCDLIVMGSHGRRGLAKLLLGSEATRVLTLSTVPVLICR
jgi:nucleotide-binding universal stress UspA family protein